MSDVSDAFPDDGVLGADEWVERWEALTGGVPGSRWLPDDVRPTDSPSERPPSDLGGANPSRVVGLPYWRGSGPVSAF